MIQSTQSRHVMALIADVTTHLAQLENRLSVMQIGHLSAEEVVTVVVQLSKLRESFPGMLAASLQSTYLESRKPITKEAA
jgi:hypothetical protein